MCCICVGMCLYIILLLLLNWCSIGLCNGVLGKCIYVVGCLVFIWLLSLMSGLYSLCLYV